MKETILISAAFWNMGETSLAVEIAKVLRNTYNTIFFSFGGLYEYVIHEENFEVIKLYPRIDNNKIDHLYKIDCCEKFGSYFNSNEIAEQVQAELVLFKKIKPVGVITGLNFSSHISARVAKIPLFSIGHSTWLCESATREGKVNIFNSEHKILNKAQIALTKLMAKIYIKSILKPYNHIAKMYGVNEFTGYEEWWAGDFTIMTEPKGFVDDLKLKTDQFYTGAIFANLKGEVPFDIGCIRKNNMDKKIIYFAMGSSGTLNLIEYVINELVKLENCIIITPLKDKIRKIGIDLPENFIATNLIPTENILPYFDAAIIHGGLGTVFSAVYAELPFISIPLNAEQELNADYCYKKGIALKIKPFKSNIKKNLRKYVELIIEEAEYKKNIRNYAIEIKDKKRLPELPYFIEKSIRKYKGDVN